MFILINNNNNARMLSYDAIILHIWFSECSKLLVYSNTIVIDNNNNNNSNILIVIYMLMINCWNIMSVSCV